ncbi:MAG TPA: class II fructose-bisphosphate aldolase [Mycobacteriales bacterium]|nr:class II fructose-bisphosphate aldolase [Mycobacteriales bacterium]
MTLATTAELVDTARAGGHGVGAFNVICLEHAEAVAAGAAAAGVAVILQVSHNAVRFHGAAGPLVAACREVAATVAVPIAVHLDHLDDPGLAGQAPALRVSSLMFDAAVRPYAENVALTRAVAERAHAAGLWVEAELGEVGGKDGAHAPGARTDPAQAADYVAATGVDGLAVAVGSSHAMVTRSARLDLGLIAALAAAVPVPLVLHGSSGVPLPALAAAVAAGITKVNVGTALNIAYTAAVRAALAADGKVVDPRRYLAGARTAMAAEVAGVVAALAGAAPVPGR